MTSAVEYVEMVRRIMRACDAIEMLRSTEKQVNK